MEQNKIKQTHWLYSFWQNSECIMVGRRVRQNDSMAEIPSLIPMPRVHSTQTNSPFCMSVLPKIGCKSRRFPEMLAKSPLKLLSKWSAVSSISCHWVVLPSTNFMIDTHTHSSMPNATWMSRGTFEIITTHRSNTQWAIKKRSKEKRSNFQQHLRQHQQQQQQHSNPHMIPLMYRQNTQRKLLFCWYKNVVFE